MEIKLELLDKYYKEHNTINNIPQNYVITHEGKIIKIGSFLNDLRKQHKLYIEKKTIPSEKTKERFKYLEKLNIDWNPKETEWRKKYNECIKYKEEFGNIDIPYNYKIEINGETIQLGVFIANQRALKRKYDEKNEKDETLEEHFKLLEELGIEWNPQEADWNKKYNACKKYYEEFGNLNLGESYLYEYNNEMIDIGVFITNQRSIYQKFKRGSISRKDSTNMESHFKLLEEIGMIWYPLESKKEEIKKEILKYKKEHNHLNIPTNYTVIINNQLFQLGMHLSDIRELYRKNINNLDNLSKQQLEEIKFLIKNGIDWDPKESYWQEMFSYLLDYKNETGTINVPSDYKIIVNKKNKRPGKFLNRQRELYRKHKENNFKDCDEKTLNHFKLLEKEGISWNPQKDEFKKNYKYLEMYYKENNTLDIPLEYIITIDNEVIKLGQIARNYKESLSKRREEIEKGTAPLEVMLRYNLLKQIGFTFTEPINLITYNGKEYTKKALCKELEIPISTFNKYYKKFNNDIDKTIRVSLLIKRTNNDKRMTKKKNPTLKNMLDSFEININELDTIGSKQKTKITRNNTILYKDNVSLRKYCIDKGYNYDVILYSLRAKQNELIEGNLEEIIDRVLIDYNKKGQQKPSTWIYSKYGNELLLKHFLISLHLDYDYILKDMSRNMITIEESIRKNIFMQESKKYKAEYLEGIYNSIIDKYNILNIDKTITSSIAVESIINYIKLITEDYSLTEEEYLVISKSFIKYVECINKYHIYEVGFTKNYEEKIKLIEKYVLDESEIEESFFVNINFGNHTLIAKGSDEYIRRKAIKKLTKKWNLLTEEEKYNELKRLKLNKQEDYKTIEDLRKDIDDIIKIINLKRNKQK